jgi:xanthine dehydrogenase accessory factor
LKGPVAQGRSGTWVPATTYIVVVTRNVLVDRQVLPQLLATPAPYIGIIGSRRRWQETKKLLGEDGMSAGELARFHSPIGLELNAETPEEIAVSIMAEVIMLHRRGTGERMAGL